ncbi:MAG TPA: 4Fe-4S dicluster domain-containing protein [Burkholderiaceae bacterium]|nr:4Fe-4S dicluster domain-containing protein [Burkholderiaceae bacterium]
MKLGLLIDMDTCVGCHACAVACKEWNGQSLMAGGAPDYDPQGAQPAGVWFNRIRHFEIADFGNGPGQCTRTVNLPMSCMHCEDADCVTVCPTGASYKRAEDGIVMVDPDKCMGCNYCAWACPYGARELDQNEGVMRKCTLCVDRIYDTALPERERQPACVLACPTHARHFGDYDDPQSKVSVLARERGAVPLMEQLGYKPVNRYLPPRAPVQVDVAPADRPGLKKRLADMVNRLVSL